MDRSTKVVLFGSSQKGENVYRKMPPIMEVLNFVDNDKSKWGSMFCGKLIISPEELVTKYDEIDKIIITSSYSDDIFEQLKNMGMDAKSYYVFDIGEDISVFQLKKNTDEYYGITEYYHFVENSEKYSIITKRANKSMENSVYFNPRWPDYKIGSWDNLWHSNPFDNLSWCLQVHMLIPVDQLIKIYYISKEEKYVSKALEIALNWIKNNAIHFGNGIILCKSKMAWNDHASSDRLSIFIELLYIIDGNDDYQNEISFLKKAIIYHGFYLNNDRYYPENNHGLMMDRALLLLATSFDTDGQVLGRWRQTAIDRLKNRINDDFSVSGVHKEHSSWYHIYVLKMLQAIMSYSSKSNIAELLEYEDKITRIEDSYLKLVNYDATLPLLGDSFHYEDMDIDKSMIKSGLFFCKEAGIATYKNDRVELYFVAWFHSQTHKHADDCSFILRVNGRDLLLDGGMYNYQESDSTRIYMRSVFAHNTVIVDKKSYDICESNIGKSRIKNVVYRDNVLSINMRHILYDGVYINRHISYIEVYDVILIVDTINSSTEHDYSQNFLVNPELKISRNSKMSQVFNDDINSLRIRQHNKIDEIEYYYGNDKPFRGWQSIVNDQKHPVHNILYNRSGKDVKFITSIEFGDYSVEKIIKDNNLILVIDDKEILIKNYCDMEP